MNRSEGLIQRFFNIGIPRGIGAPVVISGTGIAGDVNADGIVSIVDALIVAQYFTYISTRVSLDKAVADVNNSGTIDIVDALIIAQYTVGIVKALPI